MDKLNRPYGLRPKEVEKPYIFPRDRAALGGSAQRTPARGRKPARITAAQVDRVVNAMQPEPRDRFNTRMEQYERTAAEDFAMYAWLEANGKLPPAGEEIPPSYKSAYRKARASGQLSLLQQPEAR